MEFVKFDIERNSLTAGGREGCLRSGHSSVCAYSGDWVEETAGRNVV